jgi:hypothetical protein
MSSNSIEKKEDSATLETRPLCAKGEDELTPSLFGHIHLDSRLKGTTLEGNTFLATTGYIRKMLKFVLENGERCGIPKETHEEIKNTLENMEKEFIILSEIETASKKTVAKIQEYIAASATKSISIEDLNERFIQPLAESAFSKRKGRFLSIYCLQHWGWDRKSFT